MIRHFLNLLLWLLPPSRLFAPRRFCLRLAGVQVHEGVSVCGRGWIYGRGAVTLGRETWLSPGVIIYSHVDVPIVIGERCDIGPGVTLVPGGHAIGNSEGSHFGGDILVLRPVANNDEMGCGIIQCREGIEQKGMAFPAAQGRHDAKEKAVLRQIQPLARFRFVARGSNRAEAVEIDAGRH